MFIWMAYINAEKNKLHTYNNALTNCKFGKLWKTWIYTLLFYSFSACMCDSLFHLPFHFYTVFVSESYWSGARLKATLKDMDKSLKSFQDTIICSDHQVSFVQGWNSRYDFRIKFKRRKRLYTAGILVKLFKNPVLKRIMEIRWVKLLT